MTRSNRRILTVAAAIVSLAVLFVVATRERGAAADQALERDRSSVAGPRSADLEDAVGMSGTRFEEASVGALRDSAGSEVDSIRAKAPLPTLKGLVVDERGQPIAGAVIVVREDEDTGFEDWSHADPEVGRVVARTTSDTDGTFEVAGHGARLVSVGASFPGCVEARSSGCSPGSFVRLVLAAGASLEGFVTSADDGTPVAGAAVRILHGMDEETWLQVLTDTVGHFVARDLVPGSAGVLVVPRDHSQARWREVELAAGKATRADFVVEAGWVLSGRVTDARTGDPVAGAEVSTWDFVGKIVVTDGRGFYRAAGVKELPGTLAVRAPGYGRTEVRYAGEREELDVTLERGVRLTGRAIGSDGAPLAGVRVTAAALGFDERMARREWRVVRSGSDGSFEFKSLRADLELVLQLRAPGHGVFLAPVTREADGDGAVRVGDLQMSQQAVVGGRVLTQAGEVVSDASMSLSGPDEVELPVELERTLKSRLVGADEGGRFFLPELSAGTWHLSAHRPQGRWVTESFTLAVGEELLDLELRLPGGAVMRGRVQDPDGRAVVGAFVSLSAEEGQEGVRLVAKCDAAGEFEIVDVPAGRFTVSVSPPGEGGGEDGVLLERQSRGGVQADGELLEFTLHRLDGWVEGRVVDGDGRALSDVYIAVERGGSGFPADGVLTGAGGGFRLRVRDGVAVTLLGWRTFALDDARNMTVVEWRVGRSIRGRGEAGMRFEVGAGDGEDVVVRFSGE